MATETNLDLLKWPTDICAFGLAFGLGVVRILERCYPDGTPEARLFVAYVVVAFLSAFVVLRYLPSDANLEQHGSVAVSLWINLSLVLALGMPVLAILYSDTSLFWIALVMSAAAKALLALESKLQEKKVTASNRCAGSIGSRQRFESVHPILEQNPDAYALRPIVTAGLLTGTAAGYLGAVRFYSWVWYVVALACGLAYQLLSGRARMRAAVHDAL